MKKEGTDQVAENTFGTGRDSWYAEAARIGWIVPTVRDERRVSQRLREAIGRGASG